MTTSAPNYRDMATKIMVNAAYHEVIAKARKMRDEMIERAQRGYDVQIATANKLFVDTVINAFREVTDDIRPHLESGESSDDDNDD